MIVNKKIIDERSDLSDLSPKKSAKIMLANNGRYPDFNGPSKISAQTCFFPFFLFLFNEFK